MSNKIEVISVNVSAEKGTGKHPVDGIVIDERGVVDDAHAGEWHRQVSILSRESIERFSASAGIEIGPGEFAENITISGLDLGDIAILDRFRIGEVELEVTQIGKECHGDNCTVFQRVGRCVMPDEGIFCRVIHGGAVRPGDEVEFSPKPLKFRVITLSDRAFRGEYEDRSGPRAKELLEEFLRPKRWHPEIELKILPDEAPLLHRELQAARDEGVDVVITTGGTGVGPRDITPETVTAFCDKLIPGIMEAIRIKFGMEKANALLSRAVAGVSGTTLAYALPGSVRAVEEYMGEISKTMEHLILMLHGVDVH